MRNTYASGVAERGASGRPPGGVLAQALGTTTVGVADDVAGDVVGDVVGDVLGERKTAPRGDE
jgi:hypothetical protein